MQLEPAVQHASEILGCCTSSEGHHLLTSRSLRVHRIIRCTHAHMTWGPTRQQHTTLNCIAAAPLLETLLILKGGILMRPVRSALCRLLDMLQTCQHLSTPSARAAAPGLGARVSVGHAQQPLGAPLLN